MLATLKIEKLSFEFLTKVLKVGSVFFMSFKLVFKSFDL
jgi:hypothetical protein